MEISSQPNQQLEHSLLQYESHDGLDSFPLISQSSMESSLRQLRNAEFASSAARPISLLDIDIKGKQFYLSQAAKKHLNSLKGECYVISVSGNPLVGKSSLLNLLLSLFNLDVLPENISYQDMYLVGDDLESTTNGIDMFCLSKDGKNFIFLDVEGDNDPNRGETGVWIYSNLIQTVTSMSHVHLHNYLKFPQKTFFDYFQTINKIVKQNNLHAEFQTRYAFFRRDFSSKNLSTEKFQELKTRIDERLNQKDIDSSLHSLPRPPEHITDKYSGESCITETKMLCKDCQNHEFTKTLIGLCCELNDHMSKMASFKSGRHVVQILEQLVEINKKEVPFFYDGGHISRLRLERIRKEQIRIQEYLLKVEKCQVERSLSKKIQKILSDHPNLADAKVGEDFNDAQSSLTTIISKMTYIIPELSQFIDQYLLDDRASILDEEEKKALYEAYVAQFRELTEKAVDSLKAYDAIIEALCKTLMDIKVNIQKNLQEYLIAASSAFKTSLTGVLELGASGLAGFVGKEMVTKTVAGVLLGGGIAGIALTAYSAYCFIQACEKLEEEKKRHETAINKKKIEGINNVKEAEAELRKIEEFVTKLVDDLKKTQKALKDIGSDEEKSKTLNFIENISKAMDEKIHGKNLSDNIYAQLTEGMKFAEENLEKFKKCL